MSGQANRSQRSRPNREQRRRRGGDPRRGLADPRLVREPSAIAPGLPGGAPYVPMVELEADASRWMDAVAASHPGMMQRARDVERLGLPGRAPRLRHAREAAPGGLGKGVLLGEFTGRSAVSEIVLPEKKTPAGLILP